MKQSNEIENLNKYFSIFLNLMKNQTPIKSALEGFVSGEIQEFGGHTSNMDLNKNEKDQRGKTNTLLNENKQIDRSIESMSYLFEDKDTGRSHRYIKVILKYMKKL